MTEKLLAEWVEQERCAEQQLRECLDVITQRNFEYLSGRVHTRESSTLMFSTVAVSASLILLGILVGLENPLNVLSYLDSSLLTIPYVPLMLVPLVPFVFRSIICSIFKIFQNSYNWLSFIGILIIILGILYREITIHTVDKEDHDRLEEYCVNLSPTESREIGFLIETRGFIVRMFFFITLEAWIIYETSPIDFSFGINNFLWNGLYFKDYNLCFVLVILGLFIIISIGLTCFEYYRTKRNRRKKNTVPKKGCEEVRNEKNGTRRELSKKSGKQAKRSRGLS